MSLDSSQITIVILAGGRGSRMGGVDKGLLSWRGRPMIEHVLAALPKQHTLLISANRNQESYRRYAEVVSDQLADFQGPLAGLLRAMQHCQSDYLLCLPCDSPQPPADLLPRLLHRMQEQNALSAVCHDGTRLQPLFALLSTSLQPQLESWLASGNRKVDAFFTHIQAAVCDFSDHPERFHNINSPQDMPIQFCKPVLGFAAWSGTGKTTLLRQVLPLLKQHGLRIAMIKHAHHDFDIDHPGKDSYELRQAGASPMIISSRARTAIIIERPVIETPDQTEPDLQSLLDCIAPDQVDLVLVEGFKEAPIPKIELHRMTLGKPLLYPDDQAIIAIAHDGLPQPANLPELDINQPQQIASFIQEQIAITDASHAATDKIKRTRKHK